MSGNDFRDFPHPPGPQQRAEHEARMDEIRQNKADQLGITVEELMRRIDAGEPLDQ